MPSLRRWITKRISILKPGGVRAFVCVQSKKSVRLTKSNFGSFSCRERKSRKNCLKTNFAQKTPSEFSGERKLAEVALAHQVSYITHLARVAALGKRHFCVTKTQSDDATQIAITQLDGEPAPARRRTRPHARRRHSAALAHARERLEGKVKD